MDRVIPFAGRAGFPRAVKIPRLDLARVRRQNRHRPEDLPTRGERDTYPQL